MKQSTIYSLILIGFLLLAALGSSAQNSLSISGSYALIPMSRMKGEAYALSYQHALKGPWVLNTTYSYAQGWLETPAPAGNFENYELFPLNRNHAGYHLSVQAAYQLNITPRLLVGAGLGPAISYQSTLIERSKYRMNTIKYANININQNFQEGLFPGAMADLSIHFKINEKWGCLLTGKAAYYLKAQTVMTSGFGMQYYF